MTSRASYPAAQSGGRGPVFAARAAMRLSQREAAALWGVPLHDVQNAEQDGTALNPVGRSNSAGGWGPGYCLRMFLGMSQGELARALGVSRMVISQHEKTGRMFGQTIATVRRRRGRPQIDAAAVAGALKALTERRLNALLAGTTGEGGVIL